MVLWPRGVDAKLFHPREVDLGLPRPIFVCVGRVAVEKNLEAFLDLDLPGTKLIVGDGPARAALARKYPQAVFFGARQGEELAQAYAAADVFVFPSRTDTFGLVLLEALASGLPVAAFPVTGPRDVIGTAPVGVLNDDLRAACLSALKISPQACLAFAAKSTPGKPRRGRLSIRWPISAMPIRPTPRSNSSPSTRVSSPEPASRSLPVGPAYAIEFGHDRSQVRKFCPLRLPISMPPPR